MSLALVSVAALAQEPCSSAPACPEDGATPSGGLIPNCFCPVPNSCSEPNSYQCNLNLNVATQGLEWSCQCVPPPDEGPPPRRTDPCEGVVCPEGSESTKNPFGSECVCKVPPGQTMCTGECPDGSSPKALGAECACLPNSGECDGHICRDGKPPMVTATRRCVCGDGHEAPLITEPPPD